MRNSESIKMFAQHDYDAVVVGDKTPEQIAQMNYQHDDSIAMLDEMFYGTEYHERFRNEIRRLDRRLNPSAS